MTTISPLQVIDCKLTALTDQGPQVISLRGMSLYWSMWGKKYWSPQSVEHLSKTWGCDVIRLPVGSHEVETGYVGHLAAELEQLFPVIDAAIAAGVYVIMDVHNHHALRDLGASLNLLEAVASKYGDIPNIIYEVLNEPLLDIWEAVKHYSEQAIDTVRSFAPSAVCLVGTLDWCKDLESPLHNPVDRPNIMYTFHFYSATHKDADRNSLLRALQAELPVFISECGVSEADGDGVPDFNSFDAWLDLISAHSLSWCGWAVNDKMEQASSFEGGMPNGDPWWEEKLTDVGLYFRNRINGYVAKKSGIPYMGFYSSTFGRRTEEAKALSIELRRSVQLPISLLSLALPAIIRNAGTKEYDLFLLWLMHNYRTLDRYVKGIIATEITKFLGEGPLDPQKYWALYRLNDTVKFADVSGKVYI